MFPKTENLSLPGVLHLLDEARNAELRRDADSLKDILQIFWSDAETLPSFSDYPPEIRAEMLRLYGFYMTFYGRAKNFADYQAKAKDVLTLANKLFLEQQNASKAAETNVLLAFSYWNAGEVENCEAFLKLSDVDFGGDTQHPVYLQIKINQLMLLCWMDKISDAFAIYNEITPGIEFCEDIRLKILFHCESAILLQRKTKFLEAIFHFNESVRLAKENDNQHLLALTYNNLSLLYLDLKVFRDAHYFSDKSLEILKEINHTGWIPHILDSKALILLAEEKYSAALSAVEESLVYFYKGEDYNGLTASLMTRIICLLRLGKTKDAVYAYGQLQQIAEGRLGEAAAQKFAAQFEEEIYPIRGMSLDKEILELEKLLISRALIKTRGGKVKAAQILKLKNHQYLSNALNKRHPNLYEELGFRRRARRGSRDDRQKKLPKVTGGDVWESKILRIDLQGKSLIFDFIAGSKITGAFYFDEALMNRFGIGEDAIVVARAVSRLKPETPILVWHEKQILISQATYDKEFDFFIIYDEAGVPIILDEENLLGEPVGFCLFDDIERDEIKFTKLGG
jgi:hypothetical protein